jgi:hypothetical protein
LPLAGWGAFAGLYFGNPLPHSIAAKAVAYRLPPEAAAVRLLQHYGTPFFENLVLGRYFPLIGFVLYLALFALGAMHFVRHDSRAWPMALYPAAYYAAFSLANPLIFRWYLAPPLPMYFLGILGGIAKIAADIGQASGRRVSVALNGALVLFCLFSLNAWTWRPDHGPARPAPEMAWHVLELLYESVGRGLAGSVPPGGTVAAGDVGALGYYTGARILDTVGLMSPEASAYYPLPDAAYVINYAISTDLILDHRPDYVVFLEVYGRNTLLQDARFTGAYELIETVPTDIYGSDGMLIWRRRQLAN